MHHRSHDQHRGGGVVYLQEEGLPTGGGVVQTLAELEKRTFTFNSMYFHIFVQKIGILNIP